MISNKQLRLYLDRSFSIFRRVVLIMILSSLGTFRLYRQIVVTPPEPKRSETRRKLIRLLTAIDSNNPFFRSKFTAFLRKTKEAPDEIFFREYAQLPVLRKSDYEKAGLSVLNEKKSVQAERKLFRFSNSPAKNIFKLYSRDFFLPMTTGGTTGKPLTVFHDKRHMFVNSFSFLRCWRSMGWRLGEKTIIFYPANAYCNEELSRFNMFDGLHGFRFVLFNDLNLQTVVMLLREINQFRPRLLVAFPSTLNMVAHVIRKHSLPLRHHPELIEVSGETFFECQRKNIEAVFRSEVTEAYGMVEIGEIAHEVKGSDGLIVFEDLAYAETIKNSDGRNELIVTKLDIDTFPIIRYCTGDIADLVNVRQADDRGWICLKNVEGKNTNFILSSDGRKYYPLWLNGFVSELNGDTNNEIIEVKIQETHQQYMDVFFITKTGQTDSKIRESALIRLREIFGPLYQYQIHFVDFMAHNYRYKYRAIEHFGEKEIVGGLVR